MANTAILVRATSTPIAAADAVIFGVDVEVRDPAPAVKSTQAEAAQQLLVKPAARNMVFLAILAVLTAGNIVFHAHLLGFTVGDGLGGVPLLMGGIEG